MKARFSGENQWIRWLNGEAQPPWKAIHNLTDSLSSEGVEAESLLELWHRAFASIPPPLPAAPPRETPRQLPASVSHFTGRVAELKLLNRRVAKASQAAGAVIVVLIDGPAGVGKTALAVQWSHQVADHFPDGQLYVDLRGHDDDSRPPLSPDEAILGFMDALGVSAEQVPASPAARIGRYRTSLAGRRMLIVLDNAETPGQVRPLLPGTSGCLVLVTSRSELTGLAAVDGAQVIKLGVLSQKEARDLLTTRLGRSRVTRESKAISELIELCARLPLALNIAASRASVAGPALTNLVEGLRDETKRLDVLTPETPLVAYAPCCLGLLEV
jgi:hypothetical protein